MDDLTRSDVLKTLADASINGYITNKINEIAPAVKWIPCSVELPEVYKPVYIWMVPKKDGYLSDAQPQKRLAYYSDMSAHFHDMGTQKIIPDDFDIPYWMDINLIPPPDTDCAGKSIHNDNRGTGHWLNTSVEHTIKRCSMCGYAFKMNFDFNGNVYPYNFCPNCGSKNDTTFCDTSLKNEVTNNV